METTNQEFYNLLTTVLTKQTFPVILSNGLIEQFRPLNTSHLKNIIKTIVDSSLTQSQFNSAILEVIKETYAGNSSDLFDKLNVVDKILFIIETRIKSISSTVTIQDNGEEYTFNLEDVKTNLLAAVENNKELMLDHDLSVPDLTITVGIPTLQVEKQIDEELYKETNLDLNDPEQVRKLLGESFVVELAKVVKIITVNDKKLDLSTVSFKERQKTVESLPALLIQQVINYVENYKQAINECLVKDDHILTIDGSLFSLR